MMKKIIKENYLYAVIILLLLIGFTIIMKSNIYDSIVFLDEKIRDLIDNIVNVNLTIFFKIMTFLGEIYIPLLIIMCIFAFNKNKVYSYIQCASYTVAGIISLFLKLLVARPRPLNALISMPKTYSFPSGHTLTSIVFYIMLCYLLTLNKSKKCKIVCYIISSIFILYIALSRIYLGVHYFTDVLGGMLIGIPLVLMLINIVKKNIKEKWL